MDKDTAFKLYELMKKEEIEWISLQRQYSKQFLTLIIAIVGVSLGVIYQFKDNYILHLIIIFVLELNILLCLYAKKTGDRFYRRFLEAVSIIAKIEQLIGISDRRIEKTEVPFPADIYYLPNRWICRRKKYESSFKFIEAHMKRGTNELNRWTFCFLLIMNIIVIITITINLYVKLIKFLLNLNIFF